MVNIDGNTSARVCLVRLSSACGATVPRCHRAHGNRSELRQNDFEVCDGLNMLLSRTNCTTFALARAYTLSVKRESRCKDAQLTRQIANTHKLFVKLCANFACPPILALEKRNVIDICQVVSPQTASGILIHSTAWHGDVNGRELVNRRRTWMI